jgi:hypothetical protein
MEKDFIKKSYFVLYCEIFFTRLRIKFVRNDDMLDLDWNKIDSSEALRRREKYFTGSGIGIHNLQKKD